MKPLLFIDVDGVLNITIRRDVEGEFLETEHGVTYVPTGTKERLAILLEHFEPVWATAWMGSAHGHHREYLGLPETPWDFISYAGSKITEIVKYAGTRPWAFIDDSMEFEKELIHKAFSDLDNTLLITINSKTGLTDENMETLLEFAENLKRKEEGQETAEYWDQRNRSNFDSI